MSVSTGSENMDDDLVYEVLSVVEEIPRGRVASYGQILSCAELYGEYPCHRVVNAAGRTAPCFSEQRERLEAEGVKFKPNGCVDMKNYRWE